MESYMAHKNPGVPWNAAIDGSATVDTILDYEKYNGRINLVEDSNPEIRFQMTEKIAIKNKATEYREALVGIHEDNLLSSAYFSQENVQILQNGLRAGVYEMSNGEYIVPPQNVDNLKVIMRSIYLQYGRGTNDPTQVKDEIVKLNQYVLDYAVRSVYNEAQGYMNYLRDQSTLVMPLEHPHQTDRDYKHLEWKRWT
jgi:hypothetical protein